MRPRYYTLQLLRLVAAAAVVIFHSTIFGWRPDPLPSYWAGLNAGNIAVIVFFVISGFVMALQRRRPILRFALHRVLRIYPAFIVAFALGAILLLAAGVTRLDSVRFDLSILLLPFGSGSSWSGVPYWTLDYEVFFYAASCVLMLRGGRYYPYLLLLWAVWLLHSFPSFPYPPDTKYGSFVWTSPYGLYFIGGATIGLHTDGVRWPLPMFLAMVGGWAILWQMHSFLWLLLLMITAMGLVMASISVPDTQIARRLSPLGDWSYGLYLMHLPIIGALYQVLPQGSHELRSVVMVAVSGTLALAYGAVEFGLYSRYLKPLADRGVTRRAPPDQRLGPAAISTSDLAP
jgi:peptidoglycan/LPS O-acetylase OafA/YrhL